MQKHAVALRDANTEGASHNPPTPPPHTMKLKSTAKSIKFSYVLDKRGSN